MLRAPGISDALAGGCLRVGPAVGDARGGSRSRRNTTVARFEQSSPAATSPRGS